MEPVGAEKVGVRVEECIQIDHVAQPKFVGQLEDARIQRDDLRRDRRPVMAPRREHWHHRRNDDLDPGPDLAGSTSTGGAELGTLADVVTRYGAWVDHDVLVCGSPAMIRSTVSRMLVAGTPLDHIRYDPFTVD